jgi:hypothetical protein
MHSYLILCAEFETSHATDHFIVQRKSERQSYRIIVLNRALATF